VAAGYSSKNGQYSDRITSPLWGLGFAINAVAIRCMPKWQRIAPLVAAFRPRRGEMILGGVFFICGMVLWSKLVVVELVATARQSYTGKRFSAWRQNVCLVPGAAGYDLVTNRANQTA